MHSSLLPPLHFPTPSKIPLMCLPHYRPLWLSWLVNGMDNLPVTQMMVLSCIRHLLLLHSFPVPNISQVLFMFHEKCLSDPSFLFLPTSTVLGEHPSLHSQYNNSCSPHDNFFCVSNPQRLLIPLIKSAKTGGRHIKGIFEGEETRQMYVWISMLLICHYDFGNHFWQDFIPTWSNRKPLINW